MYNVIMEQDSIFTKIIKGQLPSHKVYEDDKILAFLDIYPVVDGQIVVVPKAQVKFVWDLNPEDYSSLMDATRRIVKHIQPILKTKFVGTKIEGVDVPHAHVKIYPFNSVEEYDSKQDTSVEPNHEFLSKLADKLRLGSI